MATKDSGFGTGGRKPTSNTGRNRNAFCSFCRKSYRDVGPLVEGPGDVYICGECVELCQAIIAQERRRRNPTPPLEDSSQFREKLNRLVAGQDEAKRALIGAAVPRANSRGHVLLIGPARSAKVLLARALAHVLEVPFASSDAAGLVKSISLPTVPVLYALLDASDFDVEAAQRGIVYLDGLDDPEMQETCLSAWEGHNPRPLGNIPFDLRGLLFVCGGIFPALAEYDPDQPLTADGMVKAGARSGWAQHFAAFARVTPLSEESLFQTMGLVDFTRAVVPRQEA